MSRDDADTATGTPSGTDEGGFEFVPSVKRGVSRYTDDALALVIVGTYLGVWAASYAFPDVQRPPLSDATVQLLAQVVIGWALGTRALDRLQSGR